MAGPDWLRDQRLGGALVAPTPETVVEVPDGLHYFVAVERDQRDNKGGGGEDEPIALFHGTPPWCSLRLT